MKAKEQRVLAVPSGAVLGQALGGLRPGPGHGEPAGRIMNSEKPRHEKLSQKEIFSFHVNVISFHIILHQNVT